MLERDVYRMSLIPSETGSPSFSSPGMQDPAGKVFMYAKTGVAASAEVRFLEDNGFRLADTALTFERPVRRGSRAKAAGVRRADPHDEQAVVDLARTCFTLDRFHSDPLIPKAMADRLKGEWVRNHFTGKRGAGMAVAEAGGEAAGFMLFLTAGDALVIDLVAVSPAHRGKGLSEAMALLGESLFPASRILRVGTQIGNSAAMHAYQKQGFTLARCEYVFHYHGPMPAFAARPVHPKAAA